MLSRVPDGIVDPFITTASDPSAKVFGWMTGPRLTDAPRAGRQKVPTVTCAGMPCRFRAWRSALGSSWYCWPLRRISVVLSPGPLVTENAVSLTGPELGGGRLPEMAGATGPPDVSVMAAVAPRPAVVAAS